MAYTFVLTPGLHSTLFSMYWAAHGAYRNRVSVYICRGRVVEYRASENVTPDLSSFCTLNFPPINGEIDHM